MFFFLEKEPLIAIIGDIKSSRSLENRKDTQDQLKIILDDINKKYKEEIAAKFLITLGDEFQGLLSDGKNTLKIIQEIKMRLYPVKVRFGIGVGKITTDINTEMALGADGPGYYHARTAIEALKNNERRKKREPADIRLEMEDGDDTKITLVNTIFELMQSIEQTWTDRQREIIWNLMEHQDGQKNVAARLGIVQSAVHKSLVKGHYYSYENAFKNIGHILGEIHI